ncbi:helix-turn-helix domain-containing protein [Paracoccus litorisediminis]|uniref:helix-turn-helix domain-containing protein n=1 Tax=Paracoccus litorisediminis TaxID=2006130 RepID=UPI00373696E2
MLKRLVELISIGQDGNNFYGKKPRRAHSADMKTKLLNALLERESTPAKVGPRVCAVREALGLSKAEFADSIEFDRSSLTKVERGTMGLDIAIGEKISAIYGVGLDFIYRGDLSDLPSDLRPEVLTHLANARSAP